MSTPHRRPTAEDPLDLMAVIKAADLEAFVALAEAEGFGAADGQAFQRALTAVAKPKARQGLRG